MRLRVLISSSIDEASPLARGTDGRAALDGQMGAAAASAIVFTIVSILLAVLVATVLVVAFDRGFIR